MFEYYGTKKTIAYRYPAPTHDLLVEAFGGAGYYSLLHWDRDVWLNDRNPVIAGIWRYLTQADRHDILRLRPPRLGQPITDLPGLSQVERDLVGFLVAPSASSPRLTAPKDHSWFSSGRWLRRIQFIADNLHKVRHWTITNLDYLELPCGLRASWFVDALYQYPCRAYPYTIKDYAALGEWCRNLRGESPSSATGPTRDNYAGVHYCMHPIDAHALHNSLWGTKWTN